LRQILSSSASCVKDENMRKSEKNEENINLLREVVEEGIVSRSVTLEVLTTKKPTTIVQSVRGKEVLVTGNPVFDEKGELINVVTNIRDISELNTLKQDLEKTKALTEKYYSELTMLRQKADESIGMVAHSAEMQQIVSLASRVAQVDSTLLILGESGVGKEVIARLIHEQGNRKKGPFIKVNCGAIPRELLESELFGYEAGAFTGANRRGKQGMFELANNGILFLDEVGELPLDLQVKLLHVLQDREVTRVGGTKSVQVNVRVISATNRDLNQMVKEGTFRQDLYYRLNIVPIRIPPLRERTADIIPLAYFFLHRMNQKYGMQKKLSFDLLNNLKNYPWPGNIRELENFIERLIVITEEDEISYEHVPSEMFSREEQTLEIDRPLKQIMRDVEREILSRSLKKYKTTRKTASALGIDQSTLVRKIQRLNIKVLSTEDV
ncbi:sigma-54 interaction domain-containing protein, partial [Ferviditalea candida]|nr:sigma 54-interacting transcriptional regulator [Paenibacillaceae bacterium T2]